MENAEYKNILEMLVKSNQESKQSQMELKEMLVKLDQGAKELREEMQDMKAVFSSELKKVENKCDDNLEKVRVEVEDCKERISQVEIVVGGRLEETEILIKNEINIVKKEIEEKAVEPSKREINEIRTNLDHIKVEMGVLKENLKIIGDGENMLPQPMSPTTTLPYAEEAEVSSNAYRSSVPPPIAYFLPLTFSSRQHINKGEIEVEGRPEEIEEFVKDIVVGREIENVCAQPMTTLTYAEGVETGSNAYRSSITASIAYFLSLTISSRQYCEGVHTHDYGEVSPGNHLREHGGEKLTSTCVLGKVTAPLRYISKDIKRGFDGMLLPRSRYKISDKNNDLFVPNITLSSFGYYYYCGLPKDPEESVFVRFSNLRAESFSGPENAKIVSHHLQDIVIMGRSKISRFKMKRNEPEAYVAAINLSPNFCVRPKRHFAYHRPRAKSKGPSYGRFSGDRPWKDGREFRLKIVCYELLPLLRRAMCLMLLTYHGYLIYWERGEGSSSNHTSLALRQRKYEKDKDRQTGPVCKIVSFGILF